MWKTTLPFVLSLFWSLVLTAQTTYLPSPGDEIRYDEYGVFHRPSAPDAISYEKLKADILKLQAEGKANSVDDLLSFFSRTPEYRVLFKNFTLMYNSQSAQAALVDPQHPRFLVYQDRLIMGFAEKGNSLEVFDLSIGSQEFAVHRIDLDARDPAKRFVDNPKNCKSCHGTPLRPIWGNYKTWPGAYGSNEDFVLETGKGFHTNESDFYESLLAKRGKGRFAFFELPDPTLSTDIEPTKYGRLHKLPSHPNVRFSIYLASLNNLRIARELKALPAYQAYKYAVFAALIGCEEIPRFLPPRLQRSHEARLGKNYQALLQDTLEITESEHGERVARYTELLGANFNIEEVFDVRTVFDLYNVPIVAKLRYLLEGQGHSITNWALSYRPGEYSYSFSAGPYGPEGIARNKLLPELMESNPDLHLENLHLENLIFFSQIRPGPLHDACTALRAKSIAALANVGG